MQLRGWSYLPLFIDIATVSFYILLFRFRDAVHPPSLVPLSIDISLYFFVGIISCWSFFQRVPDSKQNFRKSSITIVFVSIFRVGEGVMAIWFPSELHIRAGISQWPFIGMFWVVYFVSREYFEEQILREEKRIPDLVETRYGEVDQIKYAFYSEDRNDTHTGLVQRRKSSYISERGSIEGSSNNSSSNFNTIQLSTTIDTSFSPSLETDRLTTGTESNYSHKAKLIRIERVTLGIATACCVLLGTVTIVDQYDNKEVNFDAILSVAIFLKLICGFAFILVGIAQVLQLVHRGVLSSKAHSHGFVWFLLVVGVLLRMGIALYYELIGLSVVDYSVNLNSHIFIGIGKELFTQILPYVFHIFNIRQMRNYSARSFANESSETATRMKVFFYLAIAALHFIAVGYIHEDSYKYERADNDLLVSIARSAAYIATIDFCFVLLSFISPLIQLFHHYFNFGITRSYQKLHFHRNMAISGFFFSLIHISMHIINWALHLREFTGFYVPLITGCIMVLSFLFSIITGLLVNFNPRIRFMTSLHLPISCIGYFAFFIHGSGGKYRAYGDYLVLTVFILSLSLYGLFSLVSRVRDYEVDKKLSTFPDPSTASSSFHSSTPKYLLLSLKYPDSHSVPPGATFNLFSSHVNSYLSFFHGHAFSVFSTRNSRVTFLIRCRTSESPKRISFTAKLARDQPYTLPLQGPFKGPASSLISFLSSHSFSDFSNLFLCGWNSGFASVFSLLEYFLENRRMYKIQSINCIFSQIEEERVREKIHESIHWLCSAWMDQIELSISSSSKKTETIPPPPPLLLIESHESMENLGTLTDRFVLPNGKVPTLEYWKGIMNKNATKIWVAQVDGFANLHSSTNVLLGTEKKILFFSGANLQHDKFPSPWDTFVEYAP